VVEPRSYCCYFNCGSGRQKNKKVPLQWAFNGWKFHSFTQTASPGL
jgi:hypothetical protein